MASFGSVTTPSGVRPSLVYQLNNMWQFLPQGHEKHLKQAFYNTVANVFVILAAVAAVGVYFILAPFIRPLYWALLCGTFLYPFKWRLTDLLRTWLIGLQKSGTPFGAGLVLMPFQIGDRIATDMMTTFWDYKREVVALLVSLPVTYFLYHFVPAYTIYQVFAGLIVALNRFVDYFDSYWVLAFVLGYLICVVFTWTPTSNWLGYLSAPVWVSLFLYLANMAGPLRAPLFLCLVVIIAVGVVKELLPAVEEVSVSESDIAESTLDGADTPEHADTASVEQAPQVTGPSEGASSNAGSTAVGRHSVSDTGSSLGHKEEKRSALASVAGTSQRPGTLPGTSKSLPTVLGEPSRSPKQSDTELGSAPTLKQLKTSQVNSFFKLLLLAHFIVRVWMHVWVILLLMLLPLLHHCGRLFVHQFREGGLFYERSQQAQASLQVWWEARVSTIFPKCLRGLSAFLLKSDQQVIALLEKGLDQATSVLFILLLLVGTVLFSIIGAVQIQRETVYMASATQKMLNNTMNSEFSEWMPKADEIKVSMDSFLKNSHQKGRNIIASRVADFLPKDTSREEQENVINQVLEIWDKLYDTVSAQLAEKPSSVNKDSKLEEDVPSSEPTNLYDSLHSTLDQASRMLQMSAAVDFVKENLGMFMSVLESVFTVMKSNMTLILTVITFIFSAILGGGTAILNFVISSLIFLTTLVYLLSSSKDVYKPVELFSSFSIPSATGDSFGKAVEQAISGVFTASVKMMAFYGLYTWLIHLVFGLEIVFIPSALAAVLAAVPLVGPYWASLPAVVELWLAQGRGLSALALFVAHVLPTSMVDTLIYSEIEGGHPYVTGLAIAGGIMCLGLEGALIGPIILCCLIVVFKMYGSFITPETTSSTPSRNSKGPSGFTLKRHQSLI